MEGAQIDSTSKPDSNDINADETSSLDSNHQLAFGISMGGERTTAALHSVSITCPKLRLSLGHTLSSDAVKRNNCRELFDCDYQFRSVKSMGDH